MKTYKVYGDNEDWYVFPPNWIYLKTVKAESPKLAIRKAYNTKLKTRGWRLGDLRARLLKVGKRG